MRDRPGAREPAGSEGRRGGRGGAGAVGLGELEGEGVRREGEAWAREDAMREASSHWRCTTSLCERSCDHVMGGRGNRA